MRAYSRTGQVSLEQIRQSMNEREMDILRSVVYYRYLSARQIEALHFSAHASPRTAARSCRKVLERLAVTRALRRLERRIGGIRAGSASFVYGMGPIGARIMMNDGSKRFREPSIEFLDHTLAVAQLAIDLRVLEREGSIRIAKLSAEPECWRTFGAGFEGSITLKPDLFAALVIGGYEYRWFVEIDLSTHSAASVVRKCHLYQRYWQNGQELEREGVFPKVLWVTPSLRRETLLKRAIGSARHLTQDLFEVCRAEETVARLAGGSL